MPTCSKCGRQMTGGAPHGPWAVQYECRCGNIVAGPSQPRLTEDEFSSKHKLGRGGFAESEGK